jgi:hypothetical protein
MKKLFLTLFIVLLAFTVNAQRTTKIYTQLELKQVEESTVEPPFNILVLSGDTVKQILVVQLDTIFMISNPNFVLKADLSDSLRATEQTAFNYTNAQTLLFDANSNTIIDNSEALNGQGASYYLNRVNHTGTQTASTISDFQSSVSSNTDVTANTAKRSYPVADENKLAGIETGATADQSGAEIVSAINSEIGTTWQTGGTGGTGGDTLQGTYSPDSSDYIAQQDTNYVLLWDKDKQFYVYAPVVSDTGQAATVDLSGYFTIQAFIDSIASRDNAINTNTTTNATQANQISVLQDSISNYHTRLNYLLAQVNQLWDSLGTSGGSPPVSSNLTDSLIAHYTNNSFVDISGNGNHATTIDSINPATDRLGLVDSAMTNISTRGLSDAQVNTVSDFNFGTGDFSISFWINTSDYWTEGYRDVVGYRNGSFEIGLRGESGRRMRFRVGGTEIITSNDSLNDGVWHHVVCLRNSGTLYMYVDGVQQTETLSSVSDIRDGNYITLGNSTGLSTYQHFTGSYDDIRFYRGRALDQSTIDELRTEKGYTP